MIHSSHTRIVGLTGDSDHFKLAFKEIVEHIFGIASRQDGRDDAVVVALPLLRTLNQKAPTPCTDIAWITGLRTRTEAAGNIDANVLAKINAFVTRMSGTGA